MRLPYRPAALVLALLTLLLVLLVSPTSARADVLPDPAERGRGLQAAQTALAELGVPYTWGGGTVTGPSLGFCDGVNGYLVGVCLADHTIGFDCSGLVRFAWYRATAGNVALPHYSAAQALLGRPITDRRELLPGDLLFFAEPGGPIHHVGLYLGNGAMVHAEHTGTRVTVLPDVFDDPKWGPRFVAAARPEPAFTGPGDAR